MVQFHYQDIEDGIKANQSCRDNRQALKDRFRFNKLLIAVRKADLLLNFFGFTITTPQQHCIQSV